MGLPCHAEIGLASGKAEFDHFKLGIFPFFLFCMIDLIFKPTYTLTIDLH